MYWYESAEKKDPVVLSTRVRFARNLKHLPFPARADEEQKKKVCETAAKAFSELRRYDFSKLSPHEKNAYAEAHLCSPQFAKGTGAGRELYVSEDQRVAVMVNEEDHFRIQAICSGSDPQTAFALANAADDALLKAGEIAFSEKLGFLTACPTNLGCAMRISAMLHLPALSEAGELAALARAADRLGFTLRGAFGEGSASQGDLYQISNKGSFEQNERELIAAFETVIQKICQQELSRREQWKKTASEALEDRLYRSLGILSHARIVDYSEFVSRWSDLRLGEAMGILSFEDPCLINRLLVELMPSRLCLEDLSATDARTRDLLRAKKLREALR